MLLCVFIIKNILWFCCTNYYKQARA